LGEDTRTKEAKSDERASATITKCTDTDRAFKSGLRGGVAAILPVSRERRVQSIIARNKRPEERIKPPPKKIK
jgi:hypothetical protein